MEKIMKWFKLNVVTLVLFVLIIVSVVQAVQLNTLKTGISTTEQVVSVKQNPQSNNNGDVSVPQSIQNLPQMVGGC